MGVRSGVKPKIQGFFQKHIQAVISPRRVAEFEMKALKFMKWHGLGNDFVILDSRGQSPVATPELVRLIGHRHFGIGFDQLAEILETRDGVQIDFWNADGTRAGACGNATRCVADYVMAETGNDSLAITTARGALSARREETGLVSVNMGQPQMDWAEIPLDRDRDILHLPIDGDPVAVGMGNPHCVFFVEDASATEPSDIGPDVEVHPIFPEKTNVEFATVRPDGSIRMRVWERGTGITLACGSGACATAVAAHLRGLSARKVNMELDGGWLELDWRDDGVWMTGPTMHVSSGSFTPGFLSSAK